MKMKYLLLHLYHWFTVGDHMRRWKNSMPYYNQHMSWRPLKARLRLVCHIVFTIQFYSLHSKILVVARQVFWNGGRIIYVVYNLYQRTEVLSISIVIWWVRPLLVKITFNGTYDIENHITCNEKQKKHTLHLCHDT